MAQSLASIPASEPIESTYHLRPIILVVEDDLGIHESFRVLLEDRYTVVGTLDGPTALTIMHSYTVDLVLLDLRLPGMDGIEVLRRMKATKPQMQVVIVTAVIDVRTAVETMKLGAFDYLTKPFSEEELLSVCERALSRRSDTSSSGAQRDQTPLSGEARGERVLLVGCVPGMLATLKLALDRFCVAHLAGNVTSALWQLANGPPQLLLVDASLPSAECSRLLHVMRSSYPDRRILLISSNDPTSALRAELVSFPRYENIEDPLRFRALLQEIFTLISIGRAPGDLPFSMTLHITKAICYIGRHYAEAFTVKAMAHAIGVSEGYLGHLFSAELEMSVKQCVTRVRLEVAKQLLSDRSYTLEHIGEIAGFHDGPRLSHTFRRFTGLAPGDYRRHIGCI